NANAKDAAGAARAWLSAPLHDLECKNQRYRSVLERGDGEEWYHMRGLDRKVEGSENSGLRAFQSRQSSGLAQGFGNGSSAFGAFAAVATGRRNDRKQILPPTTDSAN